ncbi:MAG: hypothetical protein AB7V14_08680 [Kiritimatiellia bacterium]
MPRPRAPFFWAALAAPLFWSAPARAGLEWGGSLPDNRDGRLRLAGGAVLGFEGMVTETTRKLYDVTGSTWKQAYAETYDTDDFDLEGPFGAIGLSGEAAWKFFRLQFSTVFLNPSTRTTARRDYYVAVGEDIEYRGERYDHLMIPAGETFEADLFGNVTELTLAFVPFGAVAGDVLRIHPSLDFGVLLFGGYYEIDAGETTGTKAYQNPVEDFAIGGRSSGYVGLGAPQWGPGVDVRFGRAEGFGFNLQVHYLFFDYDGSTDFITTADHREKNVDFSHRNLRVRGEFEFPLRRAAVTLGVQAQLIDTEGLISSMATDEEEILEKQERFDKEFTFEMTSVLATLGLAF